MENIRENENVVRLAKPQRKGILRLIFSRFLLFFLLLALEVGLIIYGFCYLDDKFPNLVYIWRLFSVLMIIYLFNCPMDSSAKLSWMLLISFLPIAGTGILLFTQSNLGQRTTRKLIGQQIKKSR
ncbi:MAG: PLD nuclease N-terminal domain-containing protein, partial [Eubacteriales bacterium]|nr:PLD nuclease N-terminal domain-containing protein [Eubacteriales bacterium]